jgi:hypothetical protein
MLLEGDNFLWLVILFCEQESSARRSQRKLQGKEGVDVKKKIATPDLHKMVIPLLTW